MHDWSINLNCFCAAKSIKRKIHPEHYAEAAVPAEKSNITGIWLKAYHCQSFKIYFYFDLKISFNAFIFRVIWANLKTWIFFISSNSCSKKISNPQKFLPNILMSIRHCLVVCIAQQTLIRNEIRYVNVLCYCLVFMQCEMYIFLRVPTHFYRI